MGSSPQASTVIPHLIANNGTMHQVEIKWTLVGGRVMAVVDVDNGAAAASVC